MNIRNITHVNIMNFTQRQIQTRIQQPEQNSEQKFHPTSMNKEDIIGRFNDIMEKMNSIDLTVHVDEMTSEELKAKVADIKSLRGKETEEMSDEEMKAFIEHFSNKRDHLFAKLKRFEETGQLPTRINGYERFNAIDAKAQFIDRLTSSEGMDYRAIIGDYLENRIV